MSCSGDSGSEALEVKLLRPSGDIATNGIVNIQVSVTGGSAERVDLLKDGVSFASLTTLYQADWDSSSVAEGSYAVGARAYLEGETFDSNTVQITVDRTMPEIISVSPAPGTDVSINDPIELTFSEAIDPASLTDSSFSLTSTNQDSIDLSVQLSEDATKVTLTPDAQWVVPDTLTLTVEDGLSDLAGNTISTNSWEWNIPTWRQLGDSITLSANTTLSFSSLSRLLDGTLIATFVSSTGGSTSRFHVQTLVDGTWTDLTESIEITSIESDRVTYFGRNTEDMVVTWRSNSAVEVRRWNGAQWLTLNPTDIFEGGQSAPAATITPDGLLWVVSDGGGDCTAIGVAAHDGSSWSILPDGPHPSIQCPNGSPAVSVVDGQLTILGHSGSNVWISQWDGAAFTDPAEAIVATGVERLDFAHMISNAGGSAAIFIQDGKLTTRLLGDDGWYKPGNGQLNMRLDEAEAQLIDAALSEDGQLSVLFSDFTPRTFGAATRQNYLTHWNGSAWSHTNLGALETAPVALEVNAQDKPLVITQSNTTLSIREEQSTFVPPAITRPASVNPCGPFVGDMDDPESGFPQTLTETGCYTDVAARTIVEHAVAYDVNANLFSDTALKRRLIIVPEDTSATYTDIDGWVFPVGTIIIKEFTIHSVVGDPTSPVIPMETRFMIRNESADWTVASYKWASDGSEGFLRADMSETDLWPVTDPNDPSVTTHEHIYPSRGQCFQCHGTDPDLATLGLETAQLNRPFDYDGVIKNQVEAWIEAGMLAESPDAQASNLPWHPSAADSTESLDDRFRAYMHVNCAHCHFSTEGTCGDMRSATPIEDSGICDQVDSTDMMGSMLYQRVVERFPIPMPQLGTSYADPLAVELVTKWLETQTDCVTEISDEEDGD